MKLIAPIFALIFSLIARLAVAEPVSEGMAARTELHSALFRPL
jgi:hypothetical protein